MVSIPAQEVRYSWLNEKLVVLCLSSQHLRGRRKGATFFDGDFYNGRERRNGDIKRQSP